MKQMSNQIKIRWREALNQLWQRNRVHVSKDMSAAYRELANIYSNSRVISFPSGAKAGYWVAPQGWEVDSATVTACDGSVITDYGDCRLALWTNSPPFEGIVNLDELKAHNICSSKYPDRRIFHFRNQYRHEAPQWGFSIPHEIIEQLAEGNYTINIKTKFEDSFMEMVETRHSGQLSKTLLLVGHFDHPDMCLDGLVGCLAGHEAIERLKSHKTKLSYAMLSTVEIVGSVFYAKYEAKKRDIREAMFVATAGAEAPLCYQKTFDKVSAIDNVMLHISKHMGEEVATFNFREGPLGNDEIAFDTGFNSIPCGSIMRAPFDQYHTDADTPDVVNTEKFEQTVVMIMRAINVFEKNAVLKPKFVDLPRLSAPELGLYIDPISMSHNDQSKNIAEHPLFMRLDPNIHDVAFTKMHLLNNLMTYIGCLRDNQTTTLNIAEDLGLPFEVVDAYTDMWVEKGLLEKTWWNVWGD